MEIGTAALCSSLPKLFDQTISIWARAQVSARAPKDSSNLWDNCMMIYSSSNRVYKNAFIYSYGYSLSFLSPHSFILSLLSFTIFDLYMHMIRHNWRSKKWMRWKINGLTIKEHVKWSLQSKECMKKHENGRKQRIYTLSLKREREQKKIVCGLFKSHCSRIKFE